MCYSYSELQPIVPRRHIDLNSREQFMEFYPTHHITQLFPQIPLPSGKSVENSNSSMTHQELSLHQELETQTSERNVLEYMTSSNLQSFQTMFPDMEVSPRQAILPTPALHGTEMSTERQDIATSSQSSSGVTPSTPAAMRDQPDLPRVFHPVMYPPLREDIVQSVQCA